jgi:hypothetical protein
MTAAKPKMRLCQLVCQKANGCDMKGCTPEFPVHSTPATTVVDWTTRDDICEARWLRHIKGLE